MTGTTITSEVSGLMPSVSTDDQRDIGRQHDQIAMGDVDEPHHAEDQRQPGGEHGVEPAEQDALQDGVHPLHRRTPLSPASCPRMCAGPIPQSSSTMQAGGIGPRHTLALHRAGTTRSAIAASSVTPRNRPRRSSRASSSSPRLRARRGLPAGNRPGVATFSACTMSCSTMTSDDALGDDRRQARIDVADDDRREAEADLVAQQKLRIRHQRAADRDHLLLAAGQRRRSAGRARSRQHREQLVDALERPRTRRGRAGRRSAGSPRP